MIRVLTAIFMLIFSMSAYAANEDHSLCVSVAHYHHNKWGKKKEICDTAVVAEIERRMKDYKNFPSYGSPVYNKSDDEYHFPGDASPAFKNIEEEYSVESYYSNGDLSFQLTVSEDDQLEFLKWAQKSVYHDTHHFLEFLTKENAIEKQSIHDLNGQLVLPRKCEGHTAVNVMYGPSFSTPLAEWYICGEDLQRYKAYLKDLQPAPDKKACPGGRFALASEQQNEEFPDYVHVCEDNITFEVWPSVTGPLYLHDVNNLYEFLRAQYSQKTKPPTPKSRR